MAEQARDDKGRFAAANGASSAATDASKKADASGTRADHLKAAGAHQNAAAAWRSHATPDAPADVAEKASFHTAEMLRHGGASGALPGGKVDPRVVSPARDKETTAALKGLATSNFAKRREAANELGRRAMATDPARSGKAASAGDRIQAHQAAVDAHKAVAKEAERRGDQRVARLYSAVASDHERRVAQLKQPSLGKWADSK